MKVLLTGVSSFTGFWFCRALVEAGHEVVGTLTRSVAAYDGIRAQRVARLADSCRLVPECRFGSERFLALAADDGPWDCLAHHAALVAGYRNPDFDYLAAASANTHNIESVLSALTRAGCSRVIATGSVFEADEGRGDGALTAFSRYGLSKTLTWNVLRFFATKAGFSIGKFVICNPFGPFEEERFVSYLFRCWFSGETPEIRTPLYVRDNIHVSLLARTYVRFVEESVASDGVTPERRVCPSQYAETMGDFAKRVCREAGSRISGLSPAVAARRQTGFAEPRVRAGCDPIDCDSLGWSESAAWDALVDFYRAKHGRV